ncbi:cytochrome b [Shinella zoogloeoides]
MASSPLAFSLPQRVLHWLTAVLVLFNLLFPDGMNAWNRAMKRTGAATAEQVAGANVHAYIGIAILVLVTLRLILRLVQGAPAAAPQEPAIFRLVAKGAEGILYFLLFAMPVTGIAAYYLGFDGAGDLHADVFKVILWALLALHVLGALAHQFYWKTNVLRRMTVR